MYFPLGRAQGVTMSAGISYVFNMPEEYMNVHRQGKLTLADTR